MSSNDDEYKSSYATDPTYDYRYTFINAINEYVKLHGVGHNKQCQWSNDKVFKMLDEMELYDKESLIIPSNKFYFNRNADKREYKDRYKGGWASQIGHTIPS